MNITRCMCVHLVDQRGACILVNPGYSKDVLMDIEKAEVILATLHQHNLTISQFLRIVLDPCNEDKLKSSSHSALSAFLQGWPVTGTWPINTVKLMFHHHLSQDGLRVGLTYHQLSGLSPTDSDRSERGSDARRRADVPSVTVI